MQQRQRAERLEDAPATECARWPTGAGAAASDPTAAPGVLAFTFTGRASEYFGIWIVNLLLSILTLGIYSA